MTRMTALVVTLSMIGLVLCGGPASAWPIVGNVTSLEGTGEIERGAQFLDVFVGMGIESGDIIETHENSHIGFDLLDPDSGEVLTQDVTCSPGKASPKAPENPLFKKHPLLRLLKGKVRSKVKKLKPGKDFYKNRIKHYYIAGTRSTEFTFGGDPGSAQLSVYEGSVAFDNIEWVSLPDRYFTDPSDKGLLTLDLDVVVEDVTETTGLVDLLGAGNAVLVDAGYFSVGVNGGPPTPPELGAAPGHGECVPEPSGLDLIGLAMLAVRRRRR